MIFYILNKNKGENKTNSSKKENNNTGNGATNTKHI